MLKIKKTFDAMSLSIDKKIDDLKQLPKQAFDVWVKNTPKDTGNAKRSTILSGNTIKANYNYAVPLDKGHSKKSPNGMSKPTEAFIKNKLNKILGAK